MKNEKELDEKYEKMMQEMGLFDFLELQSVKERIQRDKILENMQTINKKIDSIIDLLK